MNRVRLKPAVTMLSHTDFRALFWDLDSNILELLKHPVLGYMSVSPCCLGKSVDGTRGENIINGIYNRGGALNIKFSIIY